MPKPFSNRRFVNLITLPLDSVEEMRCEMPTARCRCCDGAGYHRRTEPQTLVIDGVEVEGEMLILRECLACLPWIPGRVYSHCLS